MQVLCAPSTSLRLVPLPRSTGEDQLGHDLSGILTREAGEGDRRGRWRGRGSATLGLVSMFTTLDRAPVPPTLTLPRKGGGDTPAGALCLLFPEQILLGVDGVLDGAADPALRILEHAGEDALFRAEGVRHRAQGCLFRAGAGVKIWTVGDHQKTGL